MRSAAMGDLNGDGIPDLAIGVPEERNFGYPIGAVYIFFGPVEGIGQSFGGRTVESIDLASVDHPWDVRIVGDARTIAAGMNSRRIGNTLAIGDLNGDGIDDLLIGSTDQNEEGAHLPNVDSNHVVPTHLPGGVYLLHGRRQWQAGYDFARDEYDVRFSGDESRELGYQVGIGNIYGIGGKREIVITAPTDSVTPDTPNQTVARSYLLRLKEGGTPREIRLPDDLSTVAERFCVIEGRNYHQYDITDFETFAYREYLGDGMGKALAIGDINGDGRDDILLGAPEFGHFYGFNPGLGLSRGAVYGFYGGENLQGTRYAHPLVNGEQDLAWMAPRITAENARARFGASVLIADLTGDGKGEVIIGAPTARLDLEIYPSHIIAEGLQSPARIGESGIGQIHLFDGAAPETGAMIVNGSRSISRFGYSLAAGDLNHDGFTDLLVGAPGRNPALDRGHVWVLYGNASPLWRSTPDRHDLIQLENRRWYDDTEPVNYYLAGGTPLADGSDYLFTGPDPAGSSTRFGTFVLSGDLNPYVGDDLLVIDPFGPSPQGVTFSGMLHLFHEGTGIPWPLTIRPDSAAVNFCGGERTFTVSGGRPPYGYLWRTCAIGSVGPPYPLVCGESSTLSPPLQAEQSERGITFRVTDCVPNDLSFVVMKVRDEEGHEAVSRIDFLRPDIQVSRDRYDFGTVETGATVTIPITVANGGAAPLALSGITLTGSAELSQTNDCPSLLPPMGSCTVTVSYRPRNGSPSTSSGALLITSNDPDEPSIGVPVSGSTRMSPHIVIVGGNLVFWDVPLGSSQTQQILIRNDGNADLLISGVEKSDQPEFVITENSCVGRVLRPGIAGDSCVIAVTYTPARIEPVYATIRITSNDLTLPLFTGYLSGNGILPHLSISPDRIDLGAANREAGVVIGNTSTTRSLSWSILSDLPPWLTVAPQQGELAAGGSVAVTLHVDRSALSPGLYQHVVTIQSTGGNRTVTLSMQVVEPLVLSSATVELDLCGSSERVTVTGGIPPYGAALSGPNGSAPPDTLSMEQHPDGSVTVTLAPCTLARDGGALAQPLSILTADPPTPTEMTLHLWRSIPAPMATEDIATTVHTQCGPAAAHLVVRDAVGSEAVVEITFRGNRLWSKTFGPTLSGAIIRETTDQGFIIGSSIAQPNQPTIIDPRITRLDSGGRVVWDKRLPLPGSQGISLLLPLAAGGYLAVAGTGTPTVMKLDDTGHVLWHSMVTGAIIHSPTEQTIGTTFFSGVIETADGNYLLGGTLDIRIGDQNRVQSGIFLLSLRPDGTPAWWRYHHFGERSIAGILGMIPSPDGGLFATAVMVEDAAVSGRQKPLLLRLAADGSPIWAKVFDIPTSDQFLLLNIDAAPDATLVLAGVASYQGTPFPGGGGELPPPDGDETGGEVEPVRRDYPVLLKTAGNGTLLWAQEYRNIMGSNVAGVAVRPDGDIVVGLTESSPLHGNDALLLRTGPYGNILWQKAYGTDDDDLPTSLALTSDGGVTVGGETMSFFSEPFAYSWMLKIGGGGSCGGCGE